MVPRAQAWSVGMPGDPTVRSDHGFSPTKMNAPGNCYFRETSISVTVLTMAARQLVPDLKPPKLPGAPEPSRATIPAPPCDDLLATSADPELVALEDIELLEEGPADSEAEFDPSGVFVAPLGDADLLARGGSMQSVPVVRKSADELRSLPLDPASAFLLGAMDGMVDVETLMDLVPLSHEDVVRSLCLLVDHDVIVLI